MSPKELFLNDEALYFQLQPAVNNTNNDNLEVDGFESRCLLKTPTQHACIPYHRGSSFPIPAALGLVYNTAESFQVQPQLPTSTWSEWRMSIHARR